MTEVFKISLPGVDVKTARPDQCVVHSDYPAPKIKKGANPPHRGLIQLYLNGTYQIGTTVVYSFPHGYSYTPMVWATIANTTASNNIFGFQPFVGGINSVDVRCDSANFSVVVIVPSIGSPWTPLITLGISYAIFADNGAHS